MPETKTEIASSVLDLVGNTPLLALDRLWPGPGRILGKCEFLNPCGSIKDRSSLHMIQGALKEGKLQPGGKVIEVTSGNQGCGLAMVCSVMEHPLTITMSVGNSPQRAEMMRGLGAEVFLTEQVEGNPGNVTVADVEVAEKKAQEIIAQSGAYLVDQFGNKNNSDAHYESTGPEIWRQTGERVDAFLATVGTAGTFSGVSKYLKEKKKEIVCVAVEPEGAQVIKGDPIEKPLHLLQGSGYGVVQKLFTYETMDMTIGVSDQEAVEAKRLMGKKEGIYVGYTSGANVAAAMKLLRSGKLPKDAWVVTVLNDTGLKYSERTYDFE